MKHLALLSIIALASCSGGGGSSPAPITPTAAPTTVPLTLHKMGGAPLSATAGQLSTQRRTAQAQGLTNGLPILVESSGMVAAWAGDQAIWVTNTQTNADIAETAGTITPSGNLPISNPGFSPLSCLSQVSAVCTVHPTGWGFGTSSANGKPVGMQTLTVAFSDGTTSTTNDYVYDGWSLACASGWAYVSGVPVTQGTLAASDVYADCAGGNIDFPKGAVAVGVPTQDQYGRSETVMPTLTAAIPITSPVTVVPMASIHAGQVYAIVTQDGGFAKVYFTNSPGVPGISTGISALGMSLHAAAGGTYAF